MKNKQGGFADVLVVLLAGTVILIVGLVLDATKSLTQDELPDGWNYDQSVMEAQ